MELSLHGSQISLATRSRPQQPSVQYPIPAAIHLNNTTTTTSSGLQSNRTSSAASRRRPESATDTTSTSLNGARFSVSTTNNNRCVSSASANHSFIKANRRPRPLSADNRSHHLSFASNQLRTGKRLESNAADAIKYSEEESHRKHTSERILNDLLAEPIKRSASWRSINTAHNNVPSLGNRIKRIANPDMDASDDPSSIEEDVQDPTTDSENEPETDRPLFSNERISKLRTKPPKSVSNPDTAKKYVTFGKNNVIVQSPVPSPIPATSPLSNPKPDLPGRVSFSTSDVFEMDFSDVEEDSNPLVITRNTLPPINRNPVSQFHNVLPLIKSPMSEVKPNELRASIAPSSPSPITRNENAKDIAASDSTCCILKCNALCNSNNNQINPTKSEATSVDVAAHQHDESDRIIADYKREIEKLDRKHNEDLANIDQNNKNHANHIGKEIIVSNMDSPPEDEVVSKIISNAWNNHQAKIVNSTENSSGVNEKARTPDSSSVVINNYLKTTNQEPVVKPSPKKELNANARGNGLKKSYASKGSKSAHTAPSAKPVKALKRVSSAPHAVQKSTIIGGKPLNEFQMDKVESWMSIHEFHGTTMDDRTAYNSAWRDTPSSKTDDEGMFSYDDALGEEEEEEEEQHVGPDDCDEDNDATYADIVSVIKEIEEQKQDFDTSFTITKSIGVDPMEVTTPPDPPSSPDKMKAILTYLDQVESSCTLTLHDTYSGKIPDSFRSEIEFTVEPDIIGDIPKMSDLITLPNQQLARRVIALSLRASELSKAMQLSREHMASVRTDKSKCVRAEKQTATVRLADQKKQFESVVQRHQGFIEQLLTDKHALGEKVAAMTRRMESQNQAWQHKLEAETARVRDTALAGEKIRRERWVRENTKKIKELTVKGLEHEINAMTRDHQTEITELKRLHQQDLLDAVEDVRHKHEQLECGIRESYALDREAAIERERNAIRERFERQIADEQRAFEEQRHRMVAEHSAEKKRWQAAMQEQDDEFERRKFELVEEKKDAIYHMRNEYGEKIAAIEAKNQANLKAVEDQFESDFAIWKREHESAGNLRQNERENQIRQECRAERDRQIDAIVAKVDAESLKGQKEFDMKCSRMQEKHDTELRELERSERNFREKFAELRTKLSESEANRENVQASLKQMEMQLHHTKQLYETLLGEKESLKEAARRDIQAEVVTLRKDRDAEIERIYARVQQAIEKKDAAIEVLHKDNEALKERCIKLEAVVRQQRHDYFAKQ